LSFKKKLAVFLALINTIILFVLTAWFWSLPWLAGDEKMMIWATSAIKLNFREVPESRDFFLINVSNDLMLIDATDDLGFPVGNQVITDRAKLLELFRIINNHSTQHKYILCDLRFEDRTEYDSALNAEMRKIDRMIISFHLDNEGNPILPVIEGVTSGLSDYVIGNIFDGVYKFQLYFGDTLKLTPLIISEEIQGLESSQTGPFVKMGKWFTLNYFIMSYRLLQKDIDSQEAGFNPVNLGVLLQLNPEDVASYLENKFVVIGDFFQHDMHETIFEITSGPVVLLNALLTIQNQDSRVNIFFFIILGGTFFALSFIAIYPEDLIEIYIRKKYGKLKWVGNLTSFMTYIVMLFLVSTITFFLFNIHINAFFLAIYLFIIEKVSNFLMKKIGKISE